MQELEIGWKIENAAWEAALSIIDTKGNLTEEFDAALRKFVKRKPCKNASQDYCREKFRAAVDVAQCSIKFMRTGVGANPPKPARRYELLLELARELEAKCQEAAPIFHIAGTWHNQTGWSQIIHPGWLMQ